MITQNTYTMCDLMAISLGRLFSKSAKYPAIEDLFHDLFEKEQGSDVKWMKEKEYLLQYAQAHNKKRKGVQ